MLRRSFGLLLPIIFFLSSCSQLQEKSRDDVVIDKVLANLKDNLYNSDQIVEKNVASLKHLPDSTHFNFKRFKKIVLDALEGKKVYSHVREYYRKNVPLEAFWKTYNLFSQSETQELQKKERLDLGPKTFQKFARKRESIKNWEKKVNIIESFDDLSATSDSSIMVAKHVTNSMISFYSKVVPKSSTIKLLFRASRKKLYNFDLYTRYATSEALRYTYQDFKLKELRHWQDMLESESLQLIISHIGPALDYAYRKSLNSATSRVAGLMAEAPSHPHRVPAIIP